MTKENLEADPGTVGQDHAAIRYAGLLVGMISVIALSAMTLITVVDVVGRYIFNAPIVGADELTVFTLAAAVFSGLPLAIAHRGMITVEVLMVGLSPRMQMWMRAVSDAVSGVFLVFCARQILHIAERLGSYGQATMFLRIPTSPLAWGVAAGLLVSALVFLGFAVAPLTARRRRTKTVEAGK